ncbi:uncharacterized protein LOC125552629 [Triticum urartu]|uniref:Uncharacterized protein n=1 Tax=Triticum urartu TaxID=4572 RepID=A0A8R7Q8S5_TRIUA|nr:uncharacterized protein LOC125527077 [Triticum urartu]XP_048572203.1 uncharacterized protein LOC125552629 [Triticum urartu]
MGGGSMGIRAAARAAFIGGYRSASNARRSALPSSSAAAADTRPVPTATTFDDWYIPDREVFGPVPSHEEAMAATLDLRDAFEIAKIDSHGGRLDISKTHISHDGLDDPTKVAQETFQDHLHSEASKHEEKHDSLSVASGSSARVIEAFTMLHESPEAQDVVASLASDKNVWEAVMKNKKLVEFYKTNLSESSSVTDEAEQSDAESSQSSNGVVSPADAFSDYIQMMKAFVSEMVTNLSSIMQDLVATSDEGQSKGRLKTLIINSKKDFTNGPSSFVLLAIASILVVLLKRA